MDTKHTPVGNYRWFICFLLFLATTINYLDRQILGLLKPQLEGEFDWTETDYSYIVMAFTATYALGQLLYGRVIDRIGTKLGYSISITLWSVAAMLHALARSTFGFGFMRALLGIGESGNYPAAVKTVAEWFPRKERALAMGLVDSGANIGACIAPLIVPLISLLFGWKMAFVLTGALGLIWLVVWMIAYQLPAKSKRLGEAERNLILADDDGDDHTTADDFTWAKLIRMRQTWAFIVGKFFTDPIWYFFLFWLPSYFSSYFELNPREPNLPLAVIYLGTMVGSIGGGYLSSWLIGRGWAVHKARKRALLIAAICVIPIMTTRFFHEMWVIIGLISLSVAANQAWSANIFTMVSDMFPKKAVSSVVGMGGMAGAIGGFLFPLFIGWVLDFYKAADNIVAGYNIIFMVCGCSFLIAWLLIHWLTPRLERVRIK